MRLDFRTGPPSWPHRRRHLQRLAERLQFLEGRIGAAQGSGKRLTYDVEEASALLHALQFIRWWLEERGPAPDEPDEGDS